MSESIDFDPIADFGFDPDEAVGKQRHYQEALADHLDLLNWCASSDGQDLRSIYVEMVDSDKGRLVNDVTGLPADGKQDWVRQGYGDKMMEATRTLLNSGSTYYVAPSMVAMMEAASSGLPDDTPLVEEDLPSPHGWVRFGRPIDLNWAEATMATEEDRASMEERPTPMRIRGFAWFTLNINQRGKTTRQVHTIWFAHRDDAQDPIVQAEWLSTRDNDLLKRWLTIEDVKADNPRGDVEEHERVIAELIDDPQERERRWRQQSRWLVDGHASWTLGKTVDAIGITAKVSTALFLLLQQRIGYTRGVEPSRRLGKQAERSKLIPDIRVVMLRRRVPRNPDDEDGEKVEVQWSHRWLVQGHWRNQWYASEHRHRRIWIAPFVKGPEDAPLVVKDVVFSMER